MASSQFMPTTLSERMQATVMPKYTSQSALAVSAMRAVSLESFITPVVSAL